MFHATSTAAAKAAVAASLLRTIAEYGMGSAPSTAVSLASSTRASHWATAASAITSIDRDTNTKRSSIDETSAMPGGMSGLNWYGVVTRTAANRLNAISSP